MILGKVRDLAYPRFGDPINAQMRTRSFIVKAFFRRRSPDRPETLERCRLILSRTGRPNDVSLVGISRETNKKLSLGSGTRIGVISLR